MCACQAIHFRPDALIRATTGSETVRVRFGRVGYLGAFEIGFVLGLGATGGGKIGFVLALIGFVFRTRPSVHFFVFPCNIITYVHLTFFEIGFVLEKKGRFVERCRQM